MAETTSRRPKVNLPNSVQSDAIPDDFPGSDWKDVPYDIPTSITPESATKSKAETELILKSLAKTYTMIAQFVMLANMQDGMVIASNVDEMCESWRQLLDDNPKLRKRMMAITQSAGWGTVVTAHLAVALPIAMNHKDSFAHLIKPKQTPES